MSPDGRYLLGVQPILWDGAGSQQIHTFEFPDQALPDQPPRFSRNGQRCLISSMPTPASSFMSSLAPGKTFTAPAGTPAA